MEKIKDALAKAKSQTTQPRADVKLSSPKTHELNIESELASINYHTSTVVKLNPAHLEKNRIVSTLNGDANASTFDSLRTQVLQKMEENNWRTLAIVSPTPESGKTLVAINLAISIADLPQKTAILVDFDLRRPKVASVLGLQMNKSINEYLDGQAKAEEVMVNPSIPRLLVMPTMRPVNRSAETLSSSKVTSLINELKDRYDSRVVIFDLPPVLNADDAMVILPHVDCVLMIVASGMSTESEIEESMHYLSKSNLLGVVFNKAEIEPKAYYY